MKLVLLSGGLGNQMFIYAFCLGLRSRGNRVALVIDSNSKSIKRHHGYLMDSIFNIKRHDGVLSRFFATAYFVCFHKLGNIPWRIKQLYLRFTGTKLIEFKGNFIYHPEVYDYKSHNELFVGTWQSEKYFSGAYEEVRKAFSFKYDLLSKETIEILHNILSGDSVSIHVRRGDYLSKKYINGFGEICAIEYYKKAITYLNSKIDTPFYFLFSDDQEWVVDNLKIDNSFIVDCNKGADSWQDMFLMSRCKHNIIANSTFSWWGAWLNSNPSKIVIAPNRWWSDVERDDVVPENWIRL